MKNIIYISIVLMLSASHSYGQNSKYITAMQANIAALYAAGAATDFDPIINKFERIGQAEPSAWEPSYYMALGLTFKAFRINDLQAKDKVLDQGLAALLKAANNAANNIEIIALKGFINMIKIGVDPATRGQSLSPKIMTSFGRALKMDNSNPRAVLFMAQMQIGTAQFFGTGIAEPCQMIERAITLFDNQDKSNTLAPVWGKSSALQYRERCKISTDKSE